MKHETAIILAYGSQPPEFFSDAAKLMPKGAIMDADVARMAGANFACGMPDQLQALRKRLEAGAVAEAAQQNPGAPAGAVNWLACGERGMSSNALFTRLSGINACRDESDITAHPRDPADFRRCRLMLEACPELAQHLSKAAGLSLEWEALVMNWQTLCDLMDEETPAWRGPGAGAAPRLYERMRETLRGTPF